MPHGDTFTIESIQNNIISFTTSFIIINLNECDETINCSNFHHHLKWRLIRENKFMDSFLASKSLLLSSEINDIYQNITHPVV